MEVATREARLTPLISNAVVSRLERLRISATRRFTNRSRGEHLSGRGGSSNEFADFRDYVPGDDIRFVDWNAFARLRRPYLKLYRVEEDLHVVLLVDASSSMLFEGKLDRAKELAAAFGVMGLLAPERVSVAAFHRAGGAPARMPPATGRARMRELFRFIEGIEGGGDAPLEDGIDSLLKHHFGRGAAIVLSDFLTFGDLKRAFNRLHGAGLEILGVQILGPSERGPEVSGDLRLVDSETGTTLDVSSAADLIALYQEHRLAHERGLEQLCSQRGGRFVSIGSTDPIEGVLFDLFMRRGWIR